MRKVQHHLHQEVQVLPHHQEEQQVVLPHHREVIP
jgi:hypothetical protein